MARTDLKRMNRFELLELMYRLVTENERLASQCEELESQLRYMQRGGDPWADAQPSYAYRDPRPMTRRDEILARMDEQTSRPAPRRDAAPQQTRASPRREAAPARAPVTPPRAEAPAERYPAPSGAGRSPTPQRAPARPAQQAQSRPVPQPQQSAASRAPVKMSPKVPEADDFDIDSILEDYFSDLPFDSKGRDA